MLLLVFVGALLWGIAWLGKTTREQVTVIYEKIKMENSPDLTTPERTRLRLALSTLSEETDSIFAYQKIQKASSLVRILDAMVRDGNITPEEFRDWTGRFDLRESVDEDDLEKEERRLNKSTSSK